MVLLRVLVEAAYETWHISDYIDKHLDSRNASEWCRAVCVAVAEQSQQGNSTGFIRSE